MKKANSKTQTVSLKTIQNLEFEILKYIRDICDANGLRYYLAYGTLIGAVRHQGFIPWDDDMDIHMPRPDYMKFVEIVKANPHPYYKLISRETEPRFTLLVAKMIDSRTKLTQISLWKEKVQLGLFVDIFVLDGAGNTLEEAEAIYQKGYDCFQHWGNANTRMFYPGKGKFYSFRKWIRYSPERYYGVRRWMDRHFSLCVQKTYDTCEYISAMAAGTPQASRNVWRRDSFGVGKNVIFNEEVFRAPANWDAVLRPEYGGYMEPPPPYLQFAHHVYNLEVPDFLAPEA